VRYQAGNITEDQEIGMDEGGNMARGLQIARNATLNIENGRVVRALERIQNRTQGGGQ
jgi:hypothetical protein